VPDGHRLTQALRRTHAVELDEGGVRVALDVACRYGVVLPAAARAVQEAVAARLGRITGLPVTAVDVTVVAVTRA
jgi:uncharacterized alkaline shock family protein YloU